MKEKMKSVLSILFSTFTIIVAISAFMWAYKDIGIIGVFLAFVLWLIIEWISYKI